MKHIKIHILLLLLFVSSFAAFAQSNIPRDMPKEMYIGSSGKSGKEAILIIPKEDNSIPNSYRNFTDDNLDEFDRKMKERAWERDDTAWERATTINTVESYKRYTVQFPAGAHIAEAKCRLVDVSIDEMLHDAHNRLPDIECDEPDDNSPTSTLEIKNNTGLALTVYYSNGFSDRNSVLIYPDCTASITIENGDYKLAATVPPKHIHPYAGQTSFSGGHYKIAFYIVYR